MRAHDERVLGSGEFVERLRKEDELSDRLAVVIPLKELIEKIAAVLGIRPEALSQRSRSKGLADAQSVISYVAVRKMGRNGAEVARALNMSRSCVSIAAGRGEEIVRRSRSLRNKLDKLTT